MAQAFYAAYRQTFPVLANVPLWRGREPDRGDVGGLPRAWKSCPVLYAILSQNLSHDLSRSKRLDPEPPRGLSKITETW
jgi:hypothetical protein